MRASYVLSRTACRADTVASCDLGCMHIDYRVTVCSLRVRPLVRYRSLHNVFNKNDVRPMGQVRLLLKNWNRLSRTGPVSISNKVLKHLSAPLICRLTAIFNMTNCNFLQNWKEAVVKKPKSEAFSYRPISSLSTMGKLFYYLHVYG